MMTYEPFDPPVDEVYPAWSISCLRTPLVLAAQAKGVLGSTPSDCRPFHFSLFSPHEINLLSYLGPPCEYSWYG